jgi:HlyD family secretion protein
MSTPPAASVSGGPGRPVRRSAWRRWHVMALVLVVGGAVWWAWVESRSAASTRSDRTGPVDDEPEAPTVDVVHPKPGGIARLASQPGSVHAFESVDLYAMVSGYLKSQNVDIGSHVTKGQMLAEIGVPREAKMADEAAALIEQTRAQLRQAEARVKSEEAARNTAAATLAQTRADVERTVSRHKLAMSQFQRISALADRHAVEQRLVDEQRCDLETAVAAEQVARLAIQTAEAQLASAVARIEQARADVAEARAAERVAEARLAKAQVDLDYARITAPFDGVVTRREFHPGAFIRSATDGGEVPLLTVVRTDLMRVVVHVPDRDVVYANAGDPVTLSIDALAGEQFHGAIARVAESEDHMTRTMRIEIDLPNPKQRLRAGMYGRASIGLESHPERSTVPVSSVVNRTGGGTGAVNVVRDGRIHRAAVELGADDGASIEVISGLAADDNVVVRSPAPLEDGTAVVAKRPG